MKILHIASESVPWAKTGGLAEVVGALCSFLAKAGHEVTLALPLYRDVRLGGFDTGRAIIDVDVGLAVPVSIRQSETSAGVRVLFVDAPELFDREGLYGTASGDHPDNALRFSTLARAALAAAESLNLAPDVVHAHDWQTALAPVFARRPSRSRIAAGRPATVLTLHNLAYQGVFPAEALEVTGLPEDAAPALARGDGISFLKAGIVTADRVTTVSPTYAREIATPEFGFGLEGWIRGLRPPVVGILNGIDVEAWDPAHDPHVPRPYDVSDLQGKRDCKKALQKEFGLAVDADVPVFGMVSRLVDQKGLGLIGDLADDLGSLPVQLVFLGTGEERHEAMLRYLERMYDNVGVALRFSEPLAHLIEAGSDFYLMPSAFEPCGLNQMVSQRYGTLPIVHRVGGLADSVTHATPDAIAAGEATGVVFDHFNAPAFRWALGFALELYADPAALAAVRQAGMAADFSWQRSGREYERLYREAVEAVDETRGGT